VKNDKYPFPRVAARPRGRTAGLAGHTITQEVHVGADYSDDDVQFLKAIERYKRENRRPYPTWAEVLAVLKSLGYRKAVPT
jgi:hypothetical protein